MRKISIKGPVGLVSVAAVMAAAGCASSPAMRSRGLDQARKVYMSAAESDAAELAPRSLAEAKSALDLAKRTPPGSDEERSLAYIALRRTERAMAETRTIKAHRMTAMANDQLRNREEQLRRRAEESERALEDARRQIALFGIAIERLGSAATVKKEARGTVITISGQVLFATGKSQLLPIAVQSLARVADALKGIGASKKIVIEGHTDSTGSPAHNDQLSLERANQVKSFLASHGVDESKMEVIGRGQLEPIASNATAEGRANNRRVEIVIAEEGTEPSTRGGPSQAPKLPKPTPPRPQPVPPERLQR